VILLLAACSDGSLSKEEFIAQADRLCKKADEQAGALDVPRSPDELQAFARSAQDISEALLRDLRELKAPEEDLPTIDRMLNDMESAIAYLPQIQQAAQARDFVALQQLTAKLQETAAEANDVARTYGLQECGAFTATEAGD
jgi:hypothetical protein